jgi:YD repeat-containing protein
MILTCYWLFLKNSIFYEKALYTDITINTNFQGLTVYGPANGTTIKALSQVTFADGSSQRFDYNGYGQVYRFNSYAANGSNKLNHTYFNLDSITGAQTDCPRFTESKVWAQYWNLNSSQQPQELTTQYTVSDNETFTIDGQQHTGRLIQTTTLTDTYAQDGVVDKVYSHSSGWDEGLPLLSETWTTEQGQLVKKRWVTTYYEQDDLGLGYILNPRVIETKTSDDTNTKRTTIGYYYQPNSTVSLYGLAKDVIEYDFPSTSSQKRRTHTEYNLDAAYTSRRIIDLVSEKSVYDNVDNLVSKILFAYDGGDFTGTNQNISPIQHDNTNFGASFITGRGNLTSTTRCDVFVSSTSTCNQGVTSQVKYNTAGSPVSAIDPVGREVKTSYGDNFKDGNNTRNTFAYPTSITDPAGNVATTQYEYSYGVVTRAQGPPPNLSSPQGATGATATRLYDNLGRLQKVINDYTGAYTRYVYQDVGNVVETYTTIVDVNNNNLVDAADEAYSAVYTDGFGRTIRSVSELPNAPSGQYATSIIEYDQLGRVKRQSNPSETNSSWQPVGDDATNGWLWTSYSYDWKGRVRFKQNPDGTFAETSYAGCGCAGGEIVTQTDAGTVVDGVNRVRTRKIYHDILGRAYKTQILNWDGTVYSTVMTKYNARDQVLNVKEYQGAETSNESCPTGTCLETYSTYDGHGRLTTTKKPSQTAPDVFSYYADDTVYTKTDARGVVTSYLYNSRKLVTDISYTVPQGSNISVTAPTHYTYDAVGNLTSMTDGTGSMSYQYDPLSRLTSETRTFTGLSGSFALSYSYTLSGNVKSVSDPFGSTVNYGFDKIGRLNQVSGTGYDLSVPFISNVQYRSWGAVKEMTYGNNVKTNLAYNARQLPTSYQVTNVNNSSGSIGSIYEYYNDGMIRKVTNLSDNRFDRAYSYDQVGRLKEALSGAEARGETTADGPYKQIYNYDIWGNTISRAHREWTGQTITDNTPYTNNRHPWFGYNADGQVAGSMDGSHGYDAASRPTNFVSSATLTSGTTTLPAYEAVTTYTGNGVPSKQTTTQRQYDSSGNIYVVGTGTNYYLRSTALGGQAVAELNEQGIKKQGSIYANGMKIANCDFYSYPTP